MENLRGAALMVAAMALFAFEDLFIKTLATRISPGMVLILLGLGGGGIFALLALARGQRLLSRALLTRVFLIRNLGELIASLGFVLALALSPLSTASAILQANPLLVTLAAAVFLGAPVGWRRWLAILTGLAGVLLIVRPGLDGFQPASLFALLSVVGLAARDLTTRICPPEITALQLSTWGFLSTVPAGLLLLAIDGGTALPQGDGWWHVAGAIVAGVGGYYFIVGAMRLGDVAVVTPFRYTRLVFAMIVGITVFDETIDGLTILGSVIVVASGLYTLIREARLMRAGRRAAAAAPPVV